MRWLTTQVSGRCPLPRTIPGHPPAAGCECEQPITVPDSDGHGLFNRGGDWTNCEFLGRVLGVSSVIGVGKCFWQFTRALPGIPVSCAHMRMVFWSATGAGCLTGRRALVGVDGPTRASAPLIRSANRAQGTGVALRLPLPRQSMPPRLIATVPIRAAPSRTSNSTSTLPTSIGEETLRLIFFTAMPRTVRHRSLHRPNRRTPRRGKLS